MSLADRIWAFLQRDALKPVLVFIAGAIHLAALILSALFLKAQRDAGRLERFVRDWQPEKPEIFEIEAERK